MCLYLTRWRKASPYEQHAREFDIQESERLLTEATTLLTQQIQRGSADNVVRAYMDRALLLRRELKRLRLEGEWLTRQ